MLKSSVTTSTRLYEQFPLCLLFVKSGTRVQGTALLDSESCLFVEVICLTCTCQHVVMTTKMSSVLRCIYSQ